MKGKGLQMAAGFAVSGFFLWLALRSIDFAALKGALASVQWLYVLPFVAVTIFQMWWRAWRWKLLLAPVKECRANALFGPLMIGMGFNSVFPARAGEFARPLALSKTEGIPFPAGFSTVVLERLLDGITLLVLFAVVPLFLKFDAAVEQEWDGRRMVARSVLQLVVYGGIALALAGVAALAAFARKPQARKTTILSGAFLAVGVLAATYAALKGAFGSAEQVEFGAKIVLNSETLAGASKKMSLFVGVLVVGIGACMVPAIQRLTLAIIDRMPLLPRGLKNLLTNLFHKFTDGFASLRSPRTLVSVSLHSIGIWLLGAFSFQLMAWGVPGLEMNFWHACAYLVITCIAISLPSAPGFWGLYEAGGIVALLVLGLVPNTKDGISLALGFTLICHFFQWLVCTGIGLSYAAIVHVGRDDADAASAQV